MNRSVVIRLIHRLKICSRADLAKATGLKQATITNIVSDLIEAGFVDETGIIEGEKGRRSIGIKLNTSEYKVIGVRLARKYISISVFDMDGTQYYIKQEPIDTLAGPGSAFQKIKELVKCVLKDLKNSTIPGIGLAIPGPFFRKEGRIVLMTEFPGWEHIMIEDEIHSEFGIPIYIEHDANCGVLAEWWYGPHHRDVGTMIYIAAGQGIGTGIMIDGKIYRGSLGTAGEAGHMSIAYDGPKCECGSKGCLELYCSTLAMMKDASNELHKYPNSILNNGISVKSILSALDGKDELAQKVFKKAAWFLGFGLCSLINIYNPDVMIIGDELSQAGSELLDILDDTVRTHVLKDIYKNTKLEISTLPNDSVLMGAGALVIDKVLQNPASMLYFNK